MYVAYYFNGKILVDQETEAVPRKGEHVTIRNFDDDDEKEVSGTVIDVRWTSYIDEYDNERKHEVSVYVTDNLIDMNPGPLDLGNE